MTRTFFCALSLLMGIFVSGCTEPTNNGYQDALGPVYNRCADQSERERIKALYESEMTYNPTEGPLSEGGVDWILENQHLYEPAFIFARCRNPDAEIPVLVNYFGGIGSRTDFFKEGWSLEREEVLRQLMQSLMREVFPGYNFVLTFNHDEESWISAEEAILIIHLAFDPDRASYATGKEVSLIHPTIIGHEAGHLCPTPEDENGFCMWFPHHYPGDDYLDRSHGPPEETEGSCIMYRTGSMYGRTERDAALLVYDQKAEERIQNLSNQIRAMLSEQTNARGQNNSCATSENAETLVEK